ncbi:MAG: NADH-quinone oxidoreductase subunit I [Chloroflexi bacterium]|nr:NADH-quinone oxidoreductase subunit I [Chloroflexota bacterium]
MNGLGILKGMTLTFKHLFRKPITVQFPEERIINAPRFRGTEFLWSQERCTGCSTCAKACPDGCITIVTSRSNGQRVVERYDIDIRVCMFCGLCVEACPFGALAMSHYFETATYASPSLVFDRQRLLIPVEAQK